MSAGGCSNGKMLLIYSRNSSTVPLLRSRLVAKKSHRPQVATSGWVWLPTKLRRQPQLEGAVRRPATALVVRPCGGGPGGGERPSRSGSVRNQHGCSASVAEQPVAGLSGLQVGTPSLERLFAISVNPDRWRGHTAAKSQAFGTRSFFSIWDPSTRVRPKTIKSSGPAQLHPTLL
jgi:hypothetical protein